MRHLILASLIFASLPCLALEKKDAFNPDRWATRKQNQLLKECEKLNRKDWFTRYREIEVDVVEKLEDFDKKAIEDRDQNPDFWNFVKIVYPQDLPDEFPLKGAFETCSIWFSHFEKEKKAVAAKQGRTEYEDCMKESFKTEPPAILAPYLVCLKSLK
jgi:hypothetical protein